MSDHTSSPSPGASTSGRPAPTPGQGFFDWVRRLGIVRGDAWVGGVCGGIAARLGIDPLIVRGIAVVVALLGGPAFLVYAIAWLLLPDEVDRIHLQTLIGGVFEAATAGVIVFVLLSFLPLAQGVWWAAAWPFGSSIGWADSLGRVFWSALVIGAIVWLVVWATRRAGWNGRSWGASASQDAPSSASAPAAPDSAAPAPAAAAAADARTMAASFLDKEPAGAAPTAPPRPAAGATPAAVDEWRARQDEWRARYDEWKDRQADSNRAAREQRNAEAAARSAEAFERARLDRIANPRISGSFVAITLGLALMAGAICVAVGWSMPGVRGWEAAVGTAAATVVVGLAMIVAGALKRRSGVLAFFAIVLTVVTAMLLLGTTFIGRGYSLYFTY
ncbi:phage shock protein C (PspC) family protein [Frondihabitans sp. PhB188]|uniref:PspC domain-containing protein n=1 Tax=Frondihabitans sp. PhB188 TaxID=2485200 RepID=UPI000F4AC725|nr:PspC domain-containing protein [Frondihabitans sp. PhB188]ROQ37537.1 phage shock protein C (PspC) family protein [Frondihabitans sp. PhB188]